MMIKMLIVMPIAKALSATLSGGFGGGGGLGSLFGLPTGHSGGMGYELLPKFHNGKLPGMASKEMLAVINNDEGVFTPGQMKAMGRQVVIQMAGTSIVIEGSADSETVEKMARMLAERDAALPERVHELVTQFESRRQT
jgi:hypothetical protein